MWLHSYPSNNSGVFLTMRTMADRTNRETEPRYRQRPFDIANIGDRRSKGTGGTTQYLSPETKPGLEHDNGDDKLIY